MALRISLDGGGTFTDGVLINENGGVVTAKAPTTPADPTIGTLECLSKLASLSKVGLKDLLGQTKVIVHGTTMATNLLPNRAGAKLGTITTKGFRDRMTFLQVAKANLGGEIKAGAADMFDFRMECPKPLTRRYLMTEVEERVNYKGEVLIPLNEEDVRRVVGYLKKQGVESIAVTLFFSHLYPAHERRVGEIIKEEFPEAYVLLSSDVLQLTGEVSRWSTTMFGAYVGPKVIGYVSRIKELLKEKGFNGELVFMQSNGGVATPEIICENPGAMLVSGPAAGPSMGLALAKEHNLENVISVDMGGTSFDVGVVPEGQVNVVQMQVVDKMRFCLPSVDVSSIGAGGGSIAWVDMTGRLEVGPQSAGASPGPACYGLGGTEPTVTDADVVLGYIDPDYFLGGEKKLRKDLAEKAIKEKIADPLKLSVPKAAAAIYEVVNAKMAAAINVVFSKRGYDPRDFLLCSAGGAASVHTARLMEELGIKDILVPKVAPVYCAFGMMHADLKHGYTRPYVCEAAKVDLGTVNALFDEMEKEAIETLRKEGVAEKDILIEKAMDVRYYGQVREQNASVPKGAVTEESLRVTLDRFHEKHRKIIGYSDPNYPPEIVRLHLMGIAKTTPPRLEKISRGGSDGRKALKGKRRAFFKEYDDFVEVNVYDGNKLLADNILEGPCIIEETLTTVVVPPRMKMKVDPYGNYTTIGSGMVEGVKTQVSKEVEKGKGVDPTTLSVVWNKFEGILDEIGEKVQHGAQSFVMYAVRDLGQCLLDPEGDIVTVSAYLPPHIFTANIALQGIKKTFPEGFQPGDFIISNDPYIVRASHLPDWTHIRPIFYKDELIGFFQFRGHVADTGGFMPGGYAHGAYDIIAEGLNIPPLKIFKKGVLNADPWRLLLRNVRNPNLVEMDAMLVNGACAQAEEQMVKLCDKYGVETIKACMKEMIDVGEKVARAAIAKIPDGVYHGESAMDWDGTTDTPVWIKVEMTVKGEEITFDFSESSRQCDFVNSPVGNTIFATVGGVYPMLPPAVPKNQGSMRPLHIIAPEGSVVNPRYPATVGASAAYVAIVINDAIRDAFNKALPEMAMGVSPRPVSAIEIGMDPSVIDPRTGVPKQYFSETFAPGGGLGALKGFDGWHGGMVFGVLCNLVRPEMEFYENSVPFHVTKYECMQDWEGAGEFRGGCGVQCDIVCDANPEATFLLQTGNSDGTEVAVIGAQGEELPKNEMWIESISGEMRRLRTMAIMPIYPGEKHIAKSHGGGGWGDPLDRDLKRVQEDVQDEYISIKRAKEVYGVIVDPNTFEVDYEATEKLRKKMKAERKAKL